jgi:hypothetical protein
MLHRLQKWVSFDPTLRHTMGFWVKDDGGMNKVWTETAWLAACHGLLFRPALERAEMYLKI